MTPSVVSPNAREDVEMLHCTEETLPDGEIDLLTLVTAWAGRQVVVYQASV